MISDSSRTARPAAEEASLASLAPGTRAVIERVVSAGEPATVRRLADLGFTPGTVVEVVRRAPLRDPVIYRVKDYEICLRRAQAACIRTRATANTGTGDAARAGEGARAGDVVRAGEGARIGDAARTREAGR